MAGVHAASGAAVAVLDTGIDLSNPDLVAAPGTNCVGSGPPEDDDVDGHGTFVAGVIGARNAGAEVVGVAPGTRLYAVKVLDALGAGWVHQVICGIDWVTANAKPLGIRVANMSLSQELQDDALHLAVKRSADSGIVYTVAAGNADPGGLPRDIANESPASYPEVLTVTAASDTPTERPAAAGRHRATPRNRTTAMRRSPISQLARWTSPMWSRRPACASN